MALTKHKKCGREWQANGGSEPCPWCRATTAEQEACEALAGAHAEQEVSRHWKQEAEGLKSIVDAADKLHREIAEALGRKDMPTDLLVLTAKGLRARVAELETAEEEREAGWQLAGDAARGLRVECDGDLGHEAEQIRAERDALRERCDGLEWLVEVQEFYMYRLRNPGGWATPGMERAKIGAAWQRRSAANDELRAMYLDALAATEVKP